ncbi:MAG: metallophosphoesterase [Bacteroidia bacterium]
MGANTKKITIIGDPHGCFDTFQALLDQIEKKHNRIVVIGDIVDRGPDSYSLFEFMENSDTEMILGNHEFMFLNRNENERFNDLWIKNGGEITLDSFENHLDSKSLIRKRLADMEEWVQKLPLFIEVSNEEQRLLISHAGISKMNYDLHAGDLSMCFQLPYWHEESCLWTRKELAEISDVTQVVGHTPIEDGPVKKGSNWYIDTGCAKGPKGLAYMSAIQFEINDLKKEPRIFRQKKLEQLMN